DEGPPGSAQDVLSALDQDRSDDDALCLAEAAQILRRHLHGRSTASRYQREDEDGDPEMPDRLVLLHAPLLSLSEWGPVTAGVTGTRHQWLLSPPSSHVQCPYLADDVHDRVGMASERSNASLR